MNYEILGQRLRLARDRSRMTQTEAAQIMGFTSAALNQYESGKRKLDALTLERLARLYGVPVRDFFEEETTHNHWEEALRMSSENITASGKAGVGRLIQKLNALEELYNETETPFPGYPYSPFAPIADRQLPEPQTAVWAANKARSHYNLGSAPLLDLRSFLAAQKYQIFMLPFGQEKDAIRGLFLIHPKLGAILALNEYQPWSEQNFNLAHLFAHSLYQHDRPVIFCRPEDRSPLEKFADKFALHFLIPSEALQERLQVLEVKAIAQATEVVHLSRYFGVTYQTMLDRLDDERRLAVVLEDLKKVLPLVLARSLGYAPNMSIKPRYLEIEDRLPRIFIELAYRAVQEDRLSLRYVAEMLGISDIELEDRLNFEAVEENETVALNPV
jgi:transcriptional regulator with XRE-family HTH domain/Zn-dependent peptidase ImmA (M78 family)